MTVHVRVTFIDSASGAPVGRSDLAVDSLPQTFDAGTTVDIGDSTWLVESAEPRQRSEIVAEGSLTLRLSRVPIADPRDILFSLPTINETCPPSAATSGRPRLELHEDDWRQLELIDHVHLPTVEEELAAIRGVFAVHSVRDGDGRLTGFRSLHVRTRPNPPLRLPRRAVKALVPEVGTAAVVAIRGQAGVVADSFAIASGHLIVYGHGDDLGDAFSAAGRGGPGPGRGPWPVDARAAPQPGRLVPSRGGPRGVARRVP